MASTDTERQGKSKVFMHIMKIKIDFIGFPKASGKQLFKCI